MDAQFLRVQRELEETQRQLEIAKQHAARAEEKTAQAEEKTARLAEEMRMTTLTEYLEACHNIVFTNFTVETNMAISSKGTITKPTGRRCPDKLKPWVDFPEEQRIRLGKLFSAFPAHIKAFKSLHSLKSLGDDIAAKRVGDENALGLALEVLVARPVTLIVERLQNEDSITAEFNIGKGISFETRLSVLGGSSEGSTPPDGNKLRPDQICVFKRPEDLAGLMIAYIIEHKAPHKLTLQHLRLGLRPMDIDEEVANRATKPTQENIDAYFKYQADLRSAAAVTQTFDYMIHARTVASRQGRRSFSLK